MKHCKIFMLIAFGFSLICLGDEPIQEQRMGYRESTPWEKHTGKGYDGFYKVALKQDPSNPEKFAEWTADLSETGRRYGIYATWVADKANSRNASFDVFDAERPVNRINVNQQQAPKGMLIKETRFQKLGVFSFTSRVIRIVLTSQPDGNVVSDSVLVNPE